MTQSTDIQRVEVALPVTGEDVGVAASFFMPDAISAAMHAVGFSVEEEQEILVEIARVSENPWARLAAIKHLVARAKESLVASGHLRTLTGHATREVDGIQYTMEQQGQALLDTPPVVPGETQYAIIDEGRDPPESSGDGPDSEPERCPPPPGVEFDADGDPVGGAFGLEIETPSPEAEGDEEYEDARTGHFPPDSKRRGIAAAKDGGGSGRMV